MSTSNDALRKARDVAERVVAAARKVWEHPAFRPHRDGYIDEPDELLTQDAIEWRDALRELRAALDAAEGS